MAMMMMMMMITCKCKGWISAVETEPSSVIVTRPSSADEEPEGPRHSKKT